MRGRRISGRAHAGDVRPPGAPWCDADPWLAANPPSFVWHTEVNPSEPPTDAASVRTLLAVNESLGLPPTLGGLGSWYDGATFTL
jgi:hypothetical protein